MRIKTSGKELKNAEILTRQFWKGNTLVKEVGIHTLEIAWKGVKNKARRGNSTLPNTHTIF